MSPGPVVNVNSGTMELRSPSVLVPEHGGRDGASVGLFALGPQTGAIAAV